MLFVKRRFKENVAKRVWGSGGMGVTGAWQAWGSGLYI